ncbi:outer membrane usher protein [Paraburkholderia caballeronis]|nr:outer membrane usher protein [Paraburkholderia caballeronis]TDV18855.1 outer membrane usher protein [Paraburkholderia caballeronis]TDV26988.1 outer membrane usher protein [Paraburkholderia caballeronis]
MQPLNKRAMPRGGMRSPLRYRPLAWAAVVASGYWPFAADAADMTEAPCVPAISRENRGGDCAASSGAMTGAVTQAAAAMPDAGATNVLSAPERTPASAGPPGSLVPAVPLAQHAPVEPGASRDRMQIASAEEVEFNPAFFTGNVADLSRYSRGNPVAPGVYSIDVIVNGRRRGRFDVQFQSVPGSDIAAPCFTMAGLDRIGIDIDRVAARYKEAPTETPKDATQDTAQDLAQDPAQDAAHATGSAPPSTASGAEPSPTVCMPFAQAVPDGLAYFDTADLKLDLSVPQLDMRREASGYVDPSRWDDGVNAGIVQYSLATYSSHQNIGADLNSAYLGLQSGINVGGWRLRQWSTATWQNRSAGTHWQSVALFAQHDVTSLRSQFTIGDSLTSGDVFDSFNVRGVQLSSDDRMLPDSMRAFAPVVRGVAETNARVTVRQNNIILTETSVSPGPFEISDLPATGYGGDLDVTVTESDGRERTYHVPFASVPQLLRPGISRFNVTTGVYRDTILDAHPWVAQAVYQRGLTNVVTAYTGGQASEGYWAGLLGLALNTPAGAFAFDMTFAKTSLPTGGGPGYSGRVSYSKLVPGANTNISVAAYRYSTSHFYTLRDAIYARNQWGGRTSMYDYRTRNRIQVNINQPIGERSSVFISGSSQNYWGSARGYDLQYQVGFSSTFKRVSYSAYAQRTRLQNAALDTQIGVNLTIPLGRAESTKRGAFDYLTTNLTRNSNGDSTIQATASGNTSGVTPINYGVTASRVVSGDQKNVSAGGYGMYRSPVGTYSGNASIGNKTRQAALNVGGAIVVHGGGVTLGPPLGQAFALVEAKGAKGGTIVNGQGAKIDGNGYAVVTSLRPYRVNTVALDPSAVPMDVGLNNTSEEVVPRADSMVLVRIATVRGRPTFATVSDAHDRLLPMGSELFDESGKSVGIVGQGGLAYLRGLENDGRLLAKWGTGPQDQCVLPYRIPAEESEADGHAHIVARIRISCDPALIWAPPAKPEPGGETPGTTPDTARVTALSARFH